MEKESTTGSGGDTIPSGASTRGRLHPAMVKNIWQPGQSANPKGRAMGSRQKLTEKFINDLAANYDRDGMRAIERVAEENPFGYLQIICRLLPKDTHLTISTDLSTSLPPEQLKRIAEAWMISQQEESVLEGESVITTDSETAALPAPDEKPDPVPLRSVDSVATRKGMTQSKRPRIDLETVQDEDD